MRFLAQFIVIGVISHLVGYFTPWYGFAIVAFLAGYFINSRQNFLAGFAAIALLWTIDALLADMSSSSTLPLRVAQLFGGSSVFITYVATALVGGLVGGFACMSGAMLKTEN